MSDYYNIEKSTSKKSKREELLDKLESMDIDTGYDSYDDSNSFFPSSTMKIKEKKESNNYDLSDQWFNEMMSYQEVKPHKSSSASDVFGLEGIVLGKKKKKKKKDGKKDEVDYKKEFEPESFLYKNLLVEQTRFTEALQKEYDSIKSTKSSARGSSKQMTDLISNITNARALSMQLIDKQVNIKKQVAELSMKQKKELSAGLDSEDLSNFGATYLKNLLNNRAVLYDGGQGTPEVSEYSEDEMFENINNLLDGDDSIQRAEETELYLKYENKNVTIYVCIIDDDVENYYYLAKDENGDVIQDYPLPSRTSISVNRSTNIATDVYGQKYPILWG